MERPTLDQADVELKSAVPRVMQAFQPARFGSARRRSRQTAGVAVGASQIYSFFPNSPRR